MKQLNFLFLILAGLLLLSSFRAAGVHETSTQPLAPEQHIAGGLIRVTELPGSEDYHSAAYSPDGDQYLVVFQDGTNANDIKGRYIDASTGELLGGVFDIAASSAKEWSPDVVYDPYNKRFFVVWEKLLCRIVQGEGEVCTNVIVGRLLHGVYSNSSPFAGSEIIVAHEHNVIDLHDPRIAYNRDDNQYLVVFKRGSNAVHGQMLSAHTSSPSMLGSDVRGFPISMYVEGSEARDHDTAWGGDSSTFLVVWQNVKNIAEDGTIRAKYLHDTYQDGGSQIWGSEFKVAPFADGPDPLSNDCTFPVAAFNPEKGYYVVVFRHRAAAGLHEPSTLHAQLIKPYYEANSRKGTAFEVETDLSEEYADYSLAQIDYSGMGDTMYVVYIKNIGGPNPFITRLASVYMRRITGSYVSPRVLIRAAEEDVNKLNANVAGTTDGRALIVWSDEIDSDRDETDIAAVRLEPYWQYLPAVLYED